MNNKKSNNLKFGNFIRKTRLQLNIGLREFANEVGVSATYISKMELGDYAPPKEENIKKMARLLNINPDELLAMADKISSDIKSIINSRPDLYPTFIRKAKFQDIQIFMKELSTSK